MIADVLGLKTMDYTEKLIKILYFVTYYVSVNSNIK